MADPVKFAEAIARHYSGERHLGLVVLFDNVDKRTRDQQLKIFEAAQWFKDVTKGLILVNLRDSTFEAHKDEPPPMRSSTPLTSTSNRPGSPRSSGNASNSFWTI